MSKRSKSPTAVLESKKELDYRRQIVERDNRIKDLESRKLGYGLQPYDLELVEGLAGLLGRALDAGDPLVGQVIGREPAGVERKDEGEATRWARSFYNRVHKVVRDLEREFDKRQSGEWRPAERIEKVRCVNRDCGNVNKRIPRFVGQQREIELVYCPKCETKLAAS